MNFEKTILFVICVNDQKLYATCFDYISKLIVPTSFKIEFFSIENSTSITQAYNQAIKHKAKYKIYLHQDVFIHYNHFLIEIIDLFQKNSNLGLLGLIGCKNLPNSAVWWEGKELVGRVVDYRYGVKHYLDYQNKNSKNIEIVQAIDGLLMATQYDIPWREDLFDGFHFYDISQSLEFIKKGYKVGIPIQNDFWVTHFTGEYQLNISLYEKYRQIFLENYFMKGDI